MKKFIFTVIVAIAGWFNAQAQSVPAPERYNDFIEQVAALDQVRAEFLMNATMETLVSDPKGYRQMMELAEKRFSDAADPIHNEGLYMVVLKHAIEQYVLSNTEKEKQRLLLEGAKKNMIGTIAADFDYVTPDDKTVHHLKDLKANYVLVYFNNPDCESCEKVKERLASNDLINKMVNEKKLIVLAIYPYDDQNLWKKAKYPKMMINGWNQSRQIEYAELYDLPTLPCFYLLDKDYKVLIKNEGSLNKVEAYLNDLLNPQVAGPELPEADPTAKKQPAAVAASPSDPRTVSSEKMLGYLLENKSQEIYDSLADQVKSQVQPTTFEGALSQIETQMGKYQSHEPWMIQKFQGTEAYTTLMNFEKAQLGFIIAYDKDGKIIGINMVPAQAIKH